MTRNTLYTYNNVEELNKLYDALQANGKTILPFRFAETKDLLEAEKDNTIDITHLITYLATNTSDQLPADVNLSALDEDNRIIVNAIYAEATLKLFPLIFDSVEPLYDVDINQKLIDDAKCINRRALYSYKDNSQLNKIIQYAKENEIPFFSFSQSQKRQNHEWEELNRTELLSLVDITTMIRASLSSNAGLMYLSEQLIDCLPKALFIAHSHFAQDIIDNMPLYFEEIIPIQEKLDNLDIGEPNEASENQDRKTKFTDLDKHQIDQFKAYLNEHLIGHNLFRKRFTEAIKDFIELNKIKEKKILSIFLLGPSGLGKTEVARIANRFLNPTSSLAKINFGNYSSQDALNSLKGSPAGYVGCESGELGIKIDKSKTGIILCDEFEKTTRPVFNFFLELLEDGTYTDSMSREYDLDGYVIIFTSNLLNEKDFCKIIPPEFQSRLDLICEFKFLTNAEKKQYVDYQVKEYSTRLFKEFERKKAKMDTIRKLADVDYKNNNNLRELKRKVEKNVIRFLHD